MLLKLRSPPQKDDKRANLVLFLTLFCTSKAESYQHINKTRNHFLEVKLLLYPKLANYLPAYRSSTFCPFQASNVT